MTDNSVITLDAWGVHEQSAVVKDYSTSPFLIDGAVRRSTEPEPVTSLNVIKHGTVWAALNIIAGAVGQIPFRVRRITGDERTVDERHPMHWVLTQQPNAWQTPAVWKEWNITTALIWGNAVNRIIRNARGDVIALEPLPPQYVTYEIDDDGLPYYVFQLSPSKDPLFLELSDVVHFKGLTTDGFWGRRLAEVAVDDLTLSRSITAHASATFINGAMPGGVLQHPGKLNREARDTLREEWYRVHGGPQRAGKTAVLWEGMTYNAVAVSNTDAQLLEMLADDPVRVGRLFQLSPHKLGDYRNSAVRANIEESNREFYAETLSRRVNHLREELQLKTIRNNRSEIYPDPTELLKGDKRTQVETAAAAVTATLWNRNEGRRYLGDNPVEGGDSFGNPNTAGNQQGGQDQRDSQDDQPLELVLARCRHACKIESERLVMAAKSKRKFLDWLDSFYAKAWPEILADALPGQDTAEAARKYATIRREEVLTLAGLEKSGAALASALAETKINSAAWLLAGYLTGAVYEDA